MPTPKDLIKLTPAQRRALQAALDGDLRIWGNVWGSLVGGRIDEARVREGTLRELSDRGFLTWKATHSGGGWPYEVTPLGAAALAGTEPTPLAASSPLGFTPGHPLTWEAMNRAWNGACGDARGVLMAKAEEQGRVVVGEISLAIVSELARKLGEDRPFFEDIPLDVEASALTVPALPTT